jgi:hypothetical protein
MQEDELIKTAFAPDDLFSGADILAT